MFRYELHCHTAEGSRCSEFHAVDLVRFYHERGFDGVFISDHLTGSTTVPEGLSMAERIDYFARNGYGIAKEEGDRIGLKVFFAPELSIRRCDGADPIQHPAGNDFLILGLSPAWWREQEGFLYLPPKEQFRQIHEAGGFIIHAHPFLEADWIESIRLFPHDEDAVEVLNRHAPDFVNENARIYAERYGLPMTGGTDAHSKNHILCGIETERRCETDRDVIEAIRKGLARPFRAEWQK